MKKKGNRATKKENTQRIGTTQTTQESLEASAKILRFDDCALNGGRMEREVSIKKPEPWAPVDLHIDSFMEKTVMQKMERCINKIESSQFYHNFRNQLQTPPISEHFKKVMRKESKMSMVIYGIGNLKLEEVSRLQLSLAILMKNDFKWIGDIEVFDPILSATECQILEALGCSVLSLNEDGRRQAIKPTMFFMPHCPVLLFNNLLQVNWKPDLLSNIILFGNSFNSYEETIDLRGLEYMWAAQKFTNEFTVRNYHYSAFEGLSWLFFSPTTEIELQFMNENLKETPELWAPRDLQIDPYREKILMQEMELCIKNFESSQFYRNFRDKLQSPPIFEQLRRVLGSESKMQMVIYGIGRLELKENPRLQLSLAILMKKDFKWIGDVEVFDPVLSTTECRILEAFGCSVLTLNEYGRRQALKPTLFFMPGCCPELQNNLLQANWKSSLLSNIVLCGNSFNEYKEFSDFSLDATGHILAALKFTDEFNIKSDDFYITLRDPSWKYYNDAFHHLTWHFFSRVTEAELQFVNKS